MKKSTIKKLIPVYGLVYIYSRKEEDLNIDPWLVPCNILSIAGIVFIGVWTCSHIL